MRKILHLNSYLVDTKLYFNIYERLDNRFLQSIYVPTKESLTSDKKFDLNTGSIIYSKTIKRYHKIFYSSKINTIYKDLKKQAIHKDVDFAHAHNLFIDGAIAYKLKKEFGINYIVAIRMTDVDLQYRLMVNRRKFADKILRNASRVIFISPLYKEKLFSYMKPSMRSAIEGKCEIVPNGIDSYWLDNPSPLTEYTPGETYRILYMGLIQKRKNVDKLIEAIKQINGAGDIRVELTVIGRMRNAEKGYFKSFLSLVENNDFVTYMGHLADKSEIRKLMQNSHLVALPSQRELFGLVYIEAVSQNTPVLFCEKEGISPYLENCRFAYPVAANPLTAENIVQTIQKSINNYGTLSDFCDFSKAFSWDKLMESYEKMYEEL